MNANACLRTLAMPGPAVSTWIVTICGWLFLVALGLILAYYVLDGLVRLFGVSGWMFATAQEVRARHGWNKDLAPLWLKALLACTELPNVLSWVLPRGKSREMPKAPPELLKASITAWVTTRQDGDQGFRPMLMNPDNPNAFCALGEHMAQEDAEAITESIKELLEDLAEATFQRPATGKAPR